MYVHLFQTNNMTALVTCSAPMNTDTLTYLADYFTAPVQRKPRQDWVVSKCGTCGAHCGCERGRDVSQIMCQSCGGNQWEGVE